MRRICGGGGTGQSKGEVPFVWMGTLWSDDAGSGADNVSCTCGGGDGGNMKYDCSFFGLHFTTMDSIHDEEWHMQI